MRAAGGLVRWGLPISRIATALTVTLLALTALTGGAAAHSLRPQEPIYRLHLHASRAGPVWRRSNAQLDRRLRHRRGVAHASIVGGARIEVQQAPWQVFVIGVVPVNQVEALVLFCGGSILDETHVLTAGHCLYNPLTQTRLSAAQMLVVAGTSDVAVKEAGEQESEVAAIRVHPYYDYASGPGTPDDVGVIALKQALVFGPRAQPIALAGASPPEGSTATLTGFGLEAPQGAIEGPLHSLELTTGFSRRCGREYDALFLCATAPGGSGCDGDSGSALTYGATPSLVGVMDTVQSVEGMTCLDGAENGFVNVAAAEIRDFVEGSEAPPQAPRGGFGIELVAVPQVGHTATCSPGSWSGSPSFNYVFRNNLDDRTLQDGPTSTYSLTAADVGDTISCEVLAANPGGTGVNRTGALPSVQAEGTKEVPKKEGGGPGSGTPYTPPELPWANESGQRAAEQTVREQRELEARLAAERKTGEEREAFERAQREIEARAAALQKSPPACLVPRVKGDSLPAAKRALARAHCGLGKLTLSRRAGRRPVVVGQSQPAGRKLPVGTRVALTLGRASRKRRPWS